MKTILLSTTLCACLIAAGQGYGQTPGSAGDDDPIMVRAEKIGSHIDVYIGNLFFTSYIFPEDEKYPYFFPVNGPSGASVTSKRNGTYPHHSSLFFGADRVNGGNYWQEGLDRGQILAVKTEIVENSGPRVVISNENIWVRPGAESPIRDTRTITISAPSEDIFQIDFDVTLHTLMDVTIERTNHSFFSGRMDPDLAVTNGGTMINSEGQRSEDETFGEPSPWIDYYGPRGDTVEGMAIMQHPTSEWFPSPWFTRDYGFYSPTPLYWPEDPEQGTRLAGGEAVSFRYRVIVHSGDHEEADIAGRYEQYTEE